MMEWKTSTTPSENEFRSRMNLQFFAEAEEGHGADSDGADMDEFSGSEFEAGLFGEDFDGEDQTAEGQADPAEENEDNDTEDQRDDDQPEEPEQQAQQQDTPTAEPERMADIKFKDTTFRVPEQAIAAMAQAMGAQPQDIIGFVQKGMNYESKAARELSVLQEYAKRSGTDVAGYVSFLEQSLMEQDMRTEMEAIRAQKPDASEESIATEASRRIEARKQQEAAQRTQFQQQMQQSQQRVQQTVEQAKREAQVKAWGAYIAQTGIKSDADIPPRVLEMVTKEGKTPLEAHYAYQAEQAQEQIKTLQKQERNRTTSAGSMTGAGADMQDAFLAGLMGD